MAGELIPLVMVPRYTTFADAVARDFTTIAMDVTDYQTAIVSVWRGGLIGASAAFKVYFEESTDQESWTACDGTNPAGQDPGTNNEVQYSATLKKRWFRVKVSLTTGTDMSVTMWAMGFLEQRIS